MADTSLFGQAQDNSSPANGRYYQTADNLPWALDISHPWLHPFERVDVLFAYPQLQTWAESGGLNRLDWYTTPVAQFCWSCQ